METLRTRVDNIDLEEVRLRCEQGCSCSELGRNAGCSEKKAVNVLVPYRALNFVT